MMDYHSQLKLQAWLDGELAAREAAQLDERLAKDPEAQALLGELKMTRGVLAGFEAGVKLPESPEFFWSKILREIERQPRRVAPSRRASVFAGWQRWLAPLGAVAATMAVVLLIARSEQGPQTVTSLADSGAFTYHDFAARTTLVWLSYPADEEAGGSQADTVE
jgi:negative regulator of sigma E activity